MAILTFAVHEYKRIWNPQVPVQETNGIILKSKKYVITGEPAPIALIRRRVTERMWDAQKELRLGRAMQLINQHLELPFFEGPLHLDVTFFFRGGPSHKVSSQCLHGHKPNLSNLIKFVEDIGTGVLYSDEGAIASISSKKCYDLVPRTEFTISQLKLD